jgi:hypothetical protein
MARSGKGWQPQADLNHGAAHGIARASKCKANGGVVRSDKSGTILTQPQKSRRGVTSDPDEWQFDHVDPKSCGGTNCSSNIQILSRRENREKSND